MSMMCCGTCADWDKAQPGELKDCRFEREQKKKPDRVRAGFWCGMHSDMRKVAVFAPRREISGERLGRPITPPAVQKTAQQLPKPLPEPVASPIQPESYGDLFGGQRP